MRTALKTRQINNSLKHLITLIPQTIISQTLNVCKSVTNIEIKIYK